MVGHNSSSAFVLPVPQKFPNPKETPNQPNNRLPTKSFFVFDILMVLLFTQVIDYYFLLFLLFRFLLICCHLWFGTILCVYVFCHRDPPVCPVQLRRRLFKLSKKYPTCSKFPIYSTFAFCALKFGKLGEKHTKKFFLHTQRK